MRIRTYADLHLYYNLKEMERYNRDELQDLKTTLLKDPPDMLVFCGDLCHATYKADDIRFINIIKFITDVVDICKQKSVLFRIIGGTSTHDGKIIDILKDIFKNQYHVKCFSEVDYEDIMGYIFRYLPEPYFDTYENFKEYAFKKKADVTFYHGSVSAVLPMLTQTDNVTNLPKSVVIKQEDLINNTRLFSVGGHIHKHINLANKIFYVNSLTTHNFSDVNNIKGYMEFTLDDHDYKFKYIPNHKAPKYLDYTIDDIHLLDTEDIKSKVANILLASDSKDKIRFTITGDKVVKATSNIAFIKSMMKNYDIRINVKYTEALPENIESDDIEYYTDESISLVEKIQKLTLDDYGLELSLEEVREFITK